MREGIKKISFSRLCGKLINNFFRIENQKYLNCIKLRCIVEVRHIREFALGFKYFNIHILSDFQENERIAFSVVQKFQIIIRHV